MFEAEYEVVKKFGFAVRGIAPYRDSLLVDTGKGYKILKRSTYSADRLLFIHGAKEHLYHNGLTEIDRYHCIEETPFLSAGGGIYTLSEFPGGRECNFDNPNEIEAAARLLARLHACSRNYSCPEGAQEMSELGKTRQYYSRHLDELKKLKKLAVRGKHEFDHVFLNCVDYYYSEGVKALDLLKENIYDSLVEKTAREKSFCHRDYTYNNILIGKEKSAVINFELCAYELRVYDLVNMIKRKMRKCRWDCRIAENIIKTYEALEPLQGEEYKVMQSMFRFPQKFWRIANKYYNSRRTWTEKSFSSKVKEVLDERDDLEVFLKELQKLG